MKTKFLVFILGIAIVLLLYNIFLYRLINKAININTRNTITAFFKDKCQACEFSYEYIKAISYAEDTISVFVKVDSEDIHDEYHEFILMKMGNKYKIIGYSSDVPSYIK
ncbi:MAG: hypothetical protein K2J20_06380 [Bacilli bacterium]|nr:hypothetical protein [Bacilli bacterium]